MPTPAARADAPPSVKRRWPDLLPRLLSAVVMAVLALGTAIVGGHVFVLFWLLAAAAVLWEWQNLIGAGRAALRFGIGAVTLAVVVPFAAGGALLVGMLVLALGLLVEAVAAPAGLRGLSVAGLAYAAALAIAVTLLRASFPGGLEAILWLFAVVWGTDVMAYFGGRLVGGPKLWPRLSPAKTWSGFLIGISAGAGLGVGVSPAGTHHGAVMAMGVAAGALAQGGDLFESALKRRYGVKDASRLIPGHGGVMDRLDGFIVAASFAAVVGVARMGVDSAGLGLFKW